MSMTLPLSLPDLWPFLLTGLAIYRVSGMLVDEDGPFHLFFRWRQFAWKNLPSWVGQGFSCFYCLSFWASLLGSVCIVQSLSLGLVVVWLSLAGLIQIIRREEDRRNGFLTAAVRRASKQ